MSGMKATRQIAEKRRASARTLIVSQQLSFQVQAYSDCYQNIFFTGMFQHTKMGRSFQADGTHT